VQIFSVDILDEVGDQLIRMCGGDVVEIVNLYGFMYICQLDYI
jgi:DNA phosphorothioation-dependent restriction protein DptG